jgi:hypothetical protein
MLLQGQIKPLARCCILSPRILWVCIFRGVTMNLPLHSTFVRPIFDHTSWSNHCHSIRLLSNCTQTRVEPAPLFMSIYLPRCLLRLARAQDRMSFSIISGVMIRTSSLRISHPRLTPPLTRVSENIPNILCDFNAILRELDPLAVSEIYPASPIIFQFPVTLSKSKQKLVIPQKLNQYCSITRNTLSHTFHSMKSMQRMLAANHVQLNPQSQDPRWGVD